MRSCSGRPRSRRGCSDDDPRGLEELLDAYRKRAGRRGLRWWEADLCQHQGKYDVAAAILIAHRDEILGARGDPAAFEKKLVRSLVEAGRGAEANPSFSRNRAGPRWMGSVSPSSVRRTACTPSRPGAGVTRSTLRTCPRIVRMLPGS
jgi:hypothetical protein